MNNPLLIAAIAVAGVASLGIYLWRRQWLDALRQHFPQLRVVDAEGLPVG